VTDNELLDELKATLASVHLGTPVESVLARGRALRRRRRLLPAAATGAACLAGVAGLGAAGGLPSTAGQVSLAAFRVTAKPHHMVELAVRKHGKVNPRRLVFALRTAGVPAVYYVAGEPTCHPGKAHPSRRDRVPVSAILSSPRAGKPDVAVYRIHVSKIPRGTVIEIVIPGRGATRTPRAAGHPRPASRGGAIVTYRWAGPGGPSVRHDSVELELVTPRSC
jgi:hypothetical protein